MNVDIERHLEVINSTKTWDTICLKDQSQINTTQDSTNKDQLSPRCIQGGGARGPPRTQSFHTFQILNSWVKNIKNSLLLIQCTKKILHMDQSHHDRSPNEKSI